MGFDLSLSHSVLTREIAGLGFSVLFFKVGASESWSHFTQSKALRAQSHAKWHVTVEF